MKRIIAVLLCLMMLLLTVVACHKEEIPSSVSPDELPITRKITEFELACFADANSNTTLRLKLPKEWKIQKADDYYIFSQDEENVGTLFAGEPENGDAVMTEAKTDAFNDVTIKTYTGVLTREEEMLPYYQILFGFQDDGKDRVFTLEVKQSAMDAVMMRWCAQPEALAIKGYHDSPSLPLEEGNQQKSILILGNSFLNSNHSAIAQILRDMISTGAKDCEVYYDSIGYATVSKYATETGDRYITYRNDIAGGKYGIVFMCGLYREEDVTALQTIYDLCKSSDTRLVIFPAHNESEDKINDALNQYNDLPCLNWKDEIDMLIDGGVSSADFCKDDSHKHTTPLGGYVGAHLIYRSLFGEVPPAVSASCEYITQSEVNTLLGMYVDEGIQWVKESEIKRLG